MSLSERTVCVLFFRSFLFAASLFHFVRQRSQIFQNGENVHRHDPYGPLDSGPSLPLSRVSKARARRVWSLVLSPAVSSLYKLFWSKQLFWSSKRRQIETRERENVVTDSPNVSDGHWVSVSGSTDAIKWSTARRRRERETVRRRDPGGGKRKRRVKSGSLLLLAWSCRLCVHVDISTCVYI